MSAKHRSIDTNIVHAGELEPRVLGAVVLPIFQSSTYLYGGETAYEDLKYIRLNNTPNHRVLHDKLAALERGEAGLVASSGMAAISSSLLAFLSSGDHLLAQDCLYGGTRDLIGHDLRSFGIEYDFINASDPDSWSDLLRPNTKLIFVESITNPLMEVGNLVEVARFAHQHGLLAMIDNTFATPVNFRPIEIGFDLVLHSCTKYLNGHSDIVAGAVVGKAGLIQTVNRRLLKLGGALDPHACFLLHRGLKTLGLRVRFQNQSALEIARFLESHHAVARVNYPGLETSPGDPCTKSGFGGFGGMLSFEPNGGVEAAKRSISRLKIPIEAPSLGGIESLVTRPATTSHTGLTPEERKSVGISDSLIRLSVGIEGTADLIADLDQALSV